MHFCLAEKLHFNRLENELNYERLQTVHEAKEILRISWYNSSSICNKKTQNEIKHKWC